MCQRYKVSSVGGDLDPLVLINTPARTRTWNTGFRKPLFYPLELQGRDPHYNIPPVWSKLPESGADSGMLLLPFVEFVKFVAKNLLPRFHFPFSAYNTPNSMR